MAVQHVAAYLRISKADDRSTSVDKQRGNVRRAAAERYPGVPVIEYVDDGRSASKSRHLRAAFDAMHAALARRDVRAVVVDTLDRIDRGRGSAALWGLAEACELAGADLVGASQEIDLTTSSGELSASIMAAAARHEARRTSDRLKATNRHRASLGLRRVGGNVPWGLVRDADDRLVPHPENGPILLEVIDRVIAGTTTVRASAGQLTERGVPTARGASAWSHQALLKVLRSPALAGMTLSHGELLHRDDGFPWVQEGALLSLPRWHALQAALDARTQARATPRTRTTLPLLHGLLVDSEGHRLYRRAASPSSQQAPRYGCNKPHCRAFASASVPNLDDLVVAAFRDAAGDQPETRLVVAVPGRDAELLTRIRAEITRTTTALSRARDVETITELAQRLTLQRDTERAAEDTLAHEDVYTDAATGRTWAEAFDAASTDGERRDVLARHIELVVLRRHERTGPRAPLASRVEIRWIV